MKLGLIVFANDSGLGHQTRRLTYMLKPDRILVVDSSVFSKNKQQHFEWYDQFAGYKSNGFPTNRDIEAFVQGLTHIFVCENPLNFHLLTLAEKMRIKVYIQSNYEFCDHLDKNLPLPHKFLMPSYWKVQEMKDRFGSSTVEYLPPPIDPNEFKDARDTNFGRNASLTPHFLHIVGTLAENDRNGTMDLIRAIPHCCQNFTLTIKSQHPLPEHYIINDHRVRYQIGNENDQQKLYSGFDALILPRRYGGLSLTTNEALMSGLPVIMPNISPNTELLPLWWLVDAKEKGSFYTRTQIMVHEVEPMALASKIDEFAAEGVNIELKTSAFELAYNRFSTSVLQKKYEELWSR